MSNKVEELRNEILTRAKKETGPLVKRLEEIQGRIDQLQGRAQEANERTEGLRGTISQLRDKALSILKAGDDPFPQLREMTDKERDLEALSGLPDMSEEAAEALEAELLETQGRLHQVLAHAAAEVRAEQSREWTDKLSALVGDLEVWKEAVEAVSLCGITPQQNPTAQPGFGHNDRLLRLECLNPGVSRELGWLFR